MRPATAVSEVCGSASGGADGTVAEQACADVTLDDPLATANATDLLERTLVFPAVQRLWQGPQDWKTKRFSKNDDGGLVRPRISAP